MQQKNEVWQLVAGYLSGEPSAETLQELQQIMDSDPLLKNTIELLFHFFYSAQQEDAALMEDAWQRHLKRMSSI